MDSKPTRRLACSHCVWHFHSCFLAALLLPIGCLPRIQTHHVAGQSLHNYVGDNEASLEKFLGCFNPVLYANGTCAIEKWLERLPTDMGFTKDFKNIIHCHLAWRSPVGIMRRVK